MAGAYQHISMTKLSPTIGGEIAGRDGAPLDITAIDEAMSYGPGHHVG